MAGYTGAGESRDEESEPREKAAGPRETAARRGSLVAGIVLIVLGLLFLFFEVYPGLSARLTLAESWPLIVVGTGAFIGLVGWANSEPDTAIPACVVAGIVGILYWQSTTGDWGSWAYAWALIPGFSGIGTSVSALARRALGRPKRRLLEAGVTQVLVSLVLFGVFGSFMGGPEWLGTYWPVPLILLGLWVLARPRG